MNTKENNKLSKTMSDKAVDETITPNPPMWIGVEIPTSWGYYRICIGINQEDGHEVSFYNEADMELWLENKKKYALWINEGDIVVKHGAEAEVFDSNHELNKT